MATAQLTEPKQRLWTRDEFYRLLDLGFFQGQRVELIEGEIVEMAAQKNLHAISIKVTEDELEAAFGPGFWVRVQMTLDLNPWSAPDPDLAVVPGAPRTHSPSTNPTSALLVVEVSDTTLRYDRGRKGSLYARVGITDYWIINLVDQQVEVYRNPQPDSTQAYGYANADVQILQRGDTIVPLAAPQAIIKVENLLP